MAGSCTALLPARACGVRFPGCDVEARRFAPGFHITSNPGEEWGKREVQEGGSPPGGETPPPGRAPCLGGGEVMNCPHVLSPLFKRIGYYIPCAAEARDHPAREGQNVSIRHSLSRCSQKVIC